MDIKPVKKTILKTAPGTGRRARPGIFAGRNLGPVAGGVLFIIVLVAAGRFFRGNETILQPVQEPVQEKKAAAKPESYSRATFFFTQPLKGSLAVPESWEGRYRLADAGDTVVFSYIAHPVITAELFSIKIYPAETWEQKPDKEGAVISSEKGYVFVYKKSSQNPYQGKDAEKFQNMAKQGDEVIASFKAFEL